MQRWPAFSGIPAAQAYATTVADAIESVKPLIQIRRCRSDGAKPLHPLPGDWHGALAIDRVRWPADENGEDLKLRAADMFWRLTTCGILWGILVLGYHMSASAIM